MPRSGIRAVRMAEYRHEKTVGIRRIDRDARNLLGVAQSEVRPRFSRIRGFVHAVAGREIGAVQSLARSHVDDIRIRDRQRRSRRSSPTAGRRRSASTPVHSRWSSTRRRSPCRCKTRSAGSAHPLRISCGRRGTVRCSASESRCWRDRTMPVRSASARTETQTQRQQWRERARDDVKRTR